MINALIELCDEYMEAHNVSTDPAEEEYCKIQLCRDIGNFMTREGFGVANRKSLNYSHVLSTMNIEDHSQTNSTGDY